MKLNKTFIHHVRTTAAAETLADAVYRNLTLYDGMGMLRPFTENEREYLAEAGGLVISEVRLSLVDDDQEVNTVTSIRREHTALRKQ